MSSPRPTEIPVPPGRPGRKRSAESRAAILAATMALIREVGYAQLTIEGIAARAGVGKQTIYRWWPSKHAVVIDALLQHSTRQTPFRDTGDALADLRHHMSGVVRLFTSPVGALLRDVLAEAPNDPSIAVDFIERFWNPRRELSLAFFRTAAERGQVRLDVDPSDALDTIYSPLWTRLLIGHEPLTIHLVDSILSIVWPGLQPKA
jgi:AcrR family transcriptional regulator